MRRWIAGASSQRSMVWGWPALPYIINVTASECKQIQSRQGLPALNEMSLFTFPVITESPDISYDRTTTHWRHNDHPQHYGKIHCFDCSYWLRSSAILPNSIIGRLGTIFSPCRPAAPARKTAPPCSPVG